MFAWSVEGTIGIGASPIPLGEIVVAATIGSLNFGHNPLAYSVKQEQGHLEKKELIALKQGDHAAFKAIFERYYPLLTFIAYRYVKDQEKSKDLAQDTFFELWNKRAVINIETGLKSYLSKAVSNKCLNYIKREKRLDFAAEEDLPELSEQSGIEEKLDATALEALLEQKISQLPERCRIIFTMSRMEQKSHKEISELLGISTKTIENQMTKALKFLRAAIKLRTLGILCPLVWLRIIFSAMDIGDWLCWIVLGMTTQ